jgi:hypothetical protein
MCLYLLFHYICILFKHLYQAHYIVYTLISLPNLQISISQLLVISGAAGQLAHMQLRKTD